MNQNKTIVEAFDSVSGDLPSSVCEKVYQKYQMTLQKLKVLQIFSVLERQCLQKSVLALMLQMA